MIYRGRGAVDGRRARVLARRRREDGCIAPDGGPMADLEVTIRPREVRRDVLAAMLCVPSYLRSPVLGSGRVLRVVGPRSALHTVRQLAPLQQAETQVRGR